MPEVSISIGGRDYAVACQAGEEQYLHSAAKLLDTEASALVGQGARLPESRILLMAGLMLADKTAGVEEQLRAAQEQVRALEAEAAHLRANASAGAEPAPAPEPQRIEVPVLPEGLVQDLEALASQAEDLAETVEQKAAASF